MPQAIHCNTVQEVRNQIDRHGTLIVNLLAERTDYVFQAANLKTRGGAFKSPPVSRAIIDRVRTLAEQTGLDPAMIESVYRHLIEQSIEGESRH